MQYSKIENTKVQNRPRPIVFIEAAAARLYLRSANRLPSDSLDSCSVMFWIVTHL